MALRFEVCEQSKDGIYNVASNMYAVQIVGEIIPAMLCDLYLLPSRGISKLFFKKGEGKPK